MTSAQNESQALGDLGDRQLANATKTVPQLATITPRWLLHLLSWVPVEAGIYRVNRVVNPEHVAIQADEGGTPGPTPSKRTIPPTKALPRKIRCPRPMSITRPARASTRCARSPRCSTFT